MATKNVVSVNNVFVTAKYEIGLVEKRLLIFFISNIDNNISKVVGKERDRLQIIDPLASYIISVKDYAELYGLEFESAKDELSKAVDKLFQKEVTYVDKDKTIITTRWISSKLRYIKEEHNIALKWAVDIIPLISELRNNFTSYKLHFLRTLPSVYSLRLYELFVMELSKSRKSTIDLTIFIADLRDILVLQAKYTLFADFMKRVIEEPINHINKDGNCNIKINFKDEFGKNRYIKRGKKVTAIKFTVSWSK